MNAIQGIFTRIYTYTCVYIYPYIWARGVDGVGPTGHRGRGRGGLKGLGLGLSGSHAALVEELLVLQLQAGKN